MAADLAQGDVTIKLSGGDYSTWAAFWDDIINMTGDITCTVDASGFTENVAPAAVTESLNGHTLHVLPATFPTKTDASDGARFTCNYAGRELDMQMEGAGTVIIEGMVIIEGTSVPGYGIYVTEVDTSFTFVFRRNIIKGTNYSLKYADATVEDIQVYNNIFFDSIWGGISISAATASGIFANNTVVGAWTNINDGNLGNTFENNLCYGAGDKDYDNIGNATGNNNADSDDTALNAIWDTGANNVNGISDPFNNLGADDFTITAEGDVGTAGKDLSGDFTTDFFGTTRDNWTIGACEWISAQDIKEAASALLEVESLLYNAIQNNVAGLIEPEVEIGATWAATGTVSALIEVEAAITAIKSRIEVISALIEMGSVIGITWDAVGTPSAIIEPGASMPGGTKSPFGSLIEAEASINSGIKTPSAATIEVEIAITELKEYVRSLGGTLTSAGAVARALTAYRAFGGTLTPAGGLNAAFTLIVALGGELNLSGALSGRNPAWLILDDKLIWMGEWDIAYGYRIDDVVLYKYGEEWHVFVSKISHNVGNIPKSSPEAWHRLYQEQWL